VEVAQANDSIITSTQQGELQCHPLPVSARIGHIFPDLAKSLISVKQLCDADCTVLYTKSNATVAHNGKPILTGQRCPATGLWVVPLATTATDHHQANVLTGTKLSEMVQYSHACLFSPSLPTFEAAVKHEHLPDFPGLTLQNLRKFPPSSMAMHKGHLDQKRKNLQSTKKSAPNLEDVLYPQPLLKGQRTHNVYAASVDLHQTTGKAFSDQTGRFPHTSYGGNTSVFVLYDYDSNHIFAIPIKNHLAPSLVDAYKQTHARLVTAGHRPVLQFLDNECSKLLKEYMSEEAIEHQLAPPGIHRQNAAEKAIRTFKNHFIAGFSSTDKNFPVRAWDQLIQPAEITLNLMRRSRINPKLSAHAQINGVFDFRRHPLAPPGTKVLIHEKPHNRGSWDSHGVEGYYLGPAMEHYRCHRVLVTKTKAVRVTDTLAFFPEQVKMPTSSNLELLTAAAQDLTQALQNLEESSPLHPLSASQSQALKDLNTLLGDTSPTAPTTASNPAPALRVEAKMSKIENQQSKIQTAALDPLSNQSGLKEVYSPTMPHTIADPVLNKSDLQKNISNTAESVLNTPKSPNNSNSHDNNLLPADHHEFIKVVGHARSRPGSGSKYDVIVQWKGKFPNSPVPANVFTNQNTNLPAIEAVRKYVLQNNLSNTPGFKHYRIPEQGNVATEKVFSLTDRQKLYFKNSLQQANKAIHPDTGAEVEYLPLLKSSDGEKWELATCEEIGRLAQGFPPTIPTGTDTIHFIRLSDIPNDRTATYLRLVVADRPNKSNPRRVRFTVGGDRVNYPGSVSTKTADMTSTKILLNSVLSTPESLFMTMDIKDFYLNTPMSRSEYMFIPVNLIPQAIMDLYNLSPLVHKGKIYVEITKGMYGLPQAGKLANDKLVPILKAAGFHQCEFTPGLFKHETRPIAFCLVVDDFGVKYQGKEHAEYLLRTLQQADYIVTTDWEGQQFCGISLNWDYVHRTVELSMPGYVEKALQRFNHPQPTRPEHSPHNHAEIQYGAKQQLTAAPDKSPPLNEPDIKLLQEIIGTFLYYARAIDNTMLVALGTLASAQSQGTQATMDAAIKLLNYAATNPVAIIKYHASGMILHIHSDASYLSELKARSRAGGFFFLSDNIDPSPPDAPPPRLNGAIHIISSIMNNVMASATEAEVGALFHNAQDACPLRTTLEFLGHPQPATPIQTDNNCAEGILNDTVKQKRSKAIDMRFYWLRDRTKQKQFSIHWKRGKDNHADYFTKHFPASHHREVRPIYLHSEQALHLVQLPQSTHCEGVLNAPHLAVAMSLPFLFSDATVLTSSVVHHS